MPLQDLTPQLRTRLSRMERAVGLFVVVAGLLLLAGFGYYLHRMAANKGWFLQRVPYYVYVEDATGLKPGDPVRMMGFNIGRITAVLPMPPTPWFVEHKYNVFVQFEVIEPNYGYIWTDSKVKVNPSDLLGNRLIEVVKGQTGDVTVKERNNRVSDLLTNHLVSHAFSQPVADTNYVPLTRDTKGVWLDCEETPAVTEKVSQLVMAVESALPALTNQLVTVLSGSTEVLSNLNLLALSARPVATNLAGITAQLREPGGSLGRWLFPTNFNEQLDTTLAAANLAFTNLNTNLLLVVEKLGVSLDNLAEITSNLNVQVHANTNVLGDVSNFVVHTDELVQGLKKHWFLKSAFKTKTNKPPARP